MLEIYTIDTTTLNIILAVSLYAFILSMYEFDEIICFDIEFVL